MAFYHRETDLGKEKKKIKFRRQLSQIHLNEMPIYGWKNICYDDDEEDRPEKPRRYGVTEMKGPHYSFFTQNALQDILEYKGHFVDGLKFCGGSHSMMTKGFIKQITEMAHRHNVYVSTGDILHYQNH